MSSYPNLDNYPDDADIEPVNKIVRITPDKWSEPEPISPIGAKMPALSPIKADDVNIEVDAGRGSMALARKHVLEGCCTVYDSKRDKYIWRSVSKTSITEIGDYGVGLQLYFEFMKMAGAVLLVMAILCTPLLVISYYGDFAGFRAGFFAKTTIGNIGVCGQYGELCPDVTYYPDRSLLSGQSALLRDITPVFGALSTIAIACFGVFVFYFYYIHRPRISKAHDERHLTPMDFAVEVDFLPRTLSNPETHARYEQLLTAHFEKVAGREGTVAEVALAREYDGAIRTFLEIHDLDIEIKEAAAQAKRAVNDKELKRWTARGAKLEKRREASEALVQKQALMEETLRPVCRAFVIFTEQRFRERVLEAYTWSRQGPLLRWLQSRPLRFMGAPLFVQQTAQPINIYQENLDVSRVQKFFRSLFTVSASVVILILALAILVLTETLTRVDMQIGIGAKPVWVVGNSSVATGTCFETCGVSFFSDSACTVSLDDKIAGILHSSGGYSRLGTWANPSNTTCPLSQITRTDRCVSTLAGNPDFESGKEFPRPTVAVGRRLIMQSDSVSVPFVSAVSVVIPASAPAGPSVNMRFISSNPVVTSPQCPTDYTICPGITSTTLQLCYNSAMVCDGFPDCPYGDDEKNCSSIVCDANTQLTCPISGECVDALTGTCGEECMSTPHFNDTDACSTVADRTPAPTIFNTAAVLSILSDTFGGTCPGGFYESPCCTLTQLTSDQRTALVVSTSAFLDPNLVRVGSETTMLEWMYEYCAVFKRTGDIVTVCNPGTVWTLTSISQDCYAAMVHNRRWCECLGDVPLIPDSLRLELETCRVSSEDYIYFGSVSGKVQSTSLMDALRRGCLAEPVSRVVELTTSPRESIAFIESSVLLSQEDYLSALVASLPVNMSASVQVSAAVVNGTATVRIDISDRSGHSGDDVGPETEDTYWQIVGVLNATHTLRSIHGSEPNCTADYFQCPITRTCLPPSKLCDGIPDCEIPVPGGITPADEDIAVCADVQAPSVNITTGLCEANQFKCATLDECIPDLYWCDGVSDCTDGSDESNSGCEVQLAVRAATGASSAANKEPFERMEYQGFHFNESVSVKCISIQQPNSTLASLVVVYACDESVVFREGAGAVLRTPDLSCAKVQSVAIHPESSQSPSFSVDNYDVQHNVFGPAKFLCPTDTTVCPLLTGHPEAVCVNGVCETTVPASSVNMPVLQTPQCDLSSPISPVVASTLKAKYASHAIPGNLLDDVTYRCFCEQQAQYNSATDTLFTFPPFNSDIQKTCKEYYTVLLTDKAVGIAVIVGVTLLNNVLQVVIYWFADFERSYSLTDKATSEMWKLFIAQFVNSAILVLIVNAKFYTAPAFAFTGIGRGAYLDTTREWFINVGGGLCFSMMILVGCIIIPAYLFDLLFTRLRLKWTRKKLTQEAMNKELQCPDFMLSLRLAQSTNLIVCCVMYFSSMPIMLWTGVFYCIVAYWFDKYCLLRRCKVPPQYSDMTIRICLRLMPIAMVASCGFMVWTFGNQFVFPSGLIGGYFTRLFEDRFDEDGLMLYITGRLASNDSHNYSEYMQARLLDTTRKAAIGGLVVLAIVVLYLAGCVLYFIATHTVGSLVRVCVLTSKGRAPAMHPRLSRSFIGFGLNYEEPEPITFADAKKAMDAQRLLASYKLQANPRYKDAYQAITKVKNRSVAKSNRARLAAESSRASQVDSLKLRPRDPTDVYGEGAKFASPQIDEWAFADAAKPRTSVSDSPQADSAFESAAEESSTPGETAARMDNVSVGSGAAPLQPPVRIRSVSSTQDMMEVGAPVVASVQLAPAGALQPPHKHRRSSPSGKKEKHNKHHRD